ncbi:MAG: hypothetical protein H7833_02915 [Magnetococcus sp. DMHC-1]
MLRLIWHDQLDSIAIEVDGQRYEESPEPYLAWGRDITVLLSGTREVCQKFTFDGVNFWQFMPSYLFPLYYLSLRVDHIARREGLTIPVREFIAEAVRVGAFPCAMTSPWRDDVKFILKFFYFKITKWLTRKSGSRGDVCLVTIPRHFRRGQDIELGPLEQGLRRQGWTPFYLETPYYGSLKKRFGFFDVLRHRQGRSQHGVFFEDYATLAHVVKGLWRRLQTPSPRPVTLAGLSPFLQESLNLLIAYAERSLLPYGARFFLDIAHHFLKQHQLRHIILTYETGPFARAVILAALARSIPTLGLIHGFALFKPNYEYAVYGQNPYSTLGFTTPLLTGVYGRQQMAAFLEDSGYQAEHLRIVGNWKVFLPSAETGHAPALRYPITYFDSFMKKQIVRQMQEAAGLLKIDRRDFYYRPHPSQDLQESIAIWVEHGFLAANVLPASEYALNDVILQTGICIHDFSTTILEAATFGRQILYSTSSIIGNHLDLPEKNRFHATSDLVEKMRAIQSGQDDYRIDRGPYYEVLGAESVQRVLDLVAHQVAGKLG